MTLRRRSLLLLFLTFAALASLRLLGPSDLLDNDQERPAEYVTDVLVHGAWLCQTDIRGDITSKPPFVTWIGAMFSMLAGGVSHASVGLVSALAVFLVAVVILRVGAGKFGVEAATWAALFWLLSGTGLKQIALVRTDPTFAASVFVLAMALRCAFETGRGWVLVGVLAGVSILVKGPLGILLAAAGLLVIVWERRQPGTPRILGPWIGAVLIGALIAGAWFLLAWRNEGQPLIDKMLGRELVGHAVKDGKGRLPGHGFYKPTLYLLARFLPWSPFVFVGLWRVVFRPSPDAAQRRFERFVFAYLVFGLLVFSLAPHQRADHLLPLLPAAALLGARPFVATLGRWLDERTRRHAMIVVAILGVVAGLVWTIVATKDYAAKEEVLRPLAERARSLVASPSDLLFVSGPDALQVWAGVHQPPIQRSVGDASGNLAWQDALASLRSDSPSVALAEREDVARLLEEVPTLRDVTGSGASVRLLSNAEAVVRTRWRPPSRVRTAIVVILVITLAGALAISCDGKTFCVNEANEEGSPSP